jgi:hypothetical protein
MTSYRWTINLLRPNGGVRSISVVASDLVEVVAKVRARYPGDVITFAARMEAITT